MRKLLIVLGLLVLAALQFNVECSGGFCRALVWSRVSVHACVPTTTACTAIILVSPFPAIVI